MTRQEADRDYDGVVVYLAPDWRVVEDGVQWIVQRREQGPRQRWLSVKFCTSREGLIRRCGPGRGNVDGRQTGFPGWELLRGFPERYECGSPVLCEECERKHA